MNRLPTMLETFRGPLVAAMLVAASAAPALAAFEMVPSKAPPPSSIVSAPSPSAPLPTIAPATTVGAPVNLLAPPPPTTPVAPLAPVTTAPLPPPPAPPPPAPMPVPSPSSALSSPVSTSIAPQAPASMASVPAPTSPPPPVAPLSRAVYGAGHDLPLGQVLRQIVPPEVTVASLPAASSRTKVSFHGDGRPWFSVLQDSLAPTGIKAHLNGLVLTVDAPPLRPQDLAPEGSASVPVPVMKTKTGSSDPLPSAPSADKVLATANRDKAQPFGAAPTSASYEAATTPRLWLVKEGSTLHSTVADWSASLGFPSPADQTGYTWQIQFPARFDGTYLQALEWLTEGFASLQTRPDWEFSRVNLVTILKLK